jgi:hypothetical protein
MTTTEAENTLETLVDKHSLGSVLEMLATVCYVKANHEATIWRDGAAAKLWKHSARAADMAAFMAKKRGL